MVHMDREDKDLKTRKDYGATAAAVATHDINSIILYPFAHQVGGHTQLLTLDKSTLCKPLIPRELLFYMNVPKELTKFVPSYKGVVQIRETGTGSYPPLVCQPLRSPKSPYARYGPGSSNTLPAKFNARFKGHTNLAPPVGRIKTQRNTSSAISDCNQSKSNAIDQGDTLSNVKSRDVTDSIRSPTEQNHEDTLIRPTPIYCVHDDQSAAIGFDDIRLVTPEANNCIKPQNIIVDREIRGNSEENSNSSDQTCGYFSEDSNQSITDICGSSLEMKVQIRQCSDEKVLEHNLSERNILDADLISRPNEKYLLLLENVASKYQLPCILDLKMGTRQHGEDATEEKRHRQIAKCQASTSASLGVRLCGMQVYQVDYGGFLWYDKYYGRKMDQEGLKRALHQYFHNGFQFNEDIIDDVIDRLKLLSIAVERSPSFRFYGTSLLIIHEGCTSRSIKRCPVDVRLIDFAHTICDYTNTSKRSSSSPSVLKSSSADHLSTDTLSCPKVVTSEPSVPPRKQTKTDTDNASLEKPVDELQNLDQPSEVKPVIELTPPLLTFVKDDVAIANSTTTTNNNNINNNNNNDDDIDRATLCADDVDRTRKTSKTSIGPDKGLLFGLENLMRLLEDLKVQYQRDRRQAVDKAMENLYIPVI